MSEHTPGPWVTGAGLFDHIFAGQGRERRLIALVDNRSERTPAEELANAKLIAAAPDLLAACEMGDSLKNGPALLRCAAEVLERLTTTRIATVSCGSLPYHLLLKATAEEAAIARARGQEETT